MNTEYKNTRKSYNKHTPRLIYYMYFENYMVNLYILKYIKMMYCEYFI